MVIVIGVVGTTALVGIGLSGDIKDWKVLLGLLLGGTFIALLGTTAGCGIAGFLKIPFNVASGEQKLCYGRRQGVFTHHANFMIFYFPIGFQLSSWFIYLYK